MLLIGLIALLMLLVSPVAASVAIQFLMVEDETVAIFNNGWTTTVDMTGWSLRDEGELHKYIFPSFRLGPRSLVAVHTGIGDDSSTDLYMDRGAPIWDNDGDVATLYNAQGTRVADSQGYLLRDAVPDPLPTMILATISPRPEWTGPLPTPVITGAIPTLVPTTIRTTAQPGDPSPPVILPLPTREQLAPIAPAGISSPTHSTFAFGKRYAVGNPGSLIGMRFRSGGSSTVTGEPTAERTPTEINKPGSRAYGLVPPTGQFVRWYPAMRWAADI